MKEFAPEQIEQTRNYLISKATPVETVKVGNDFFSYFVLDPELNPLFQDFAFRMTGRDKVKGGATGIFGVSSDVPPEMRPYWMEYEIRAFWGSDLSKENRLLDAERTTLDSVPYDIKNAYIIRRTNFFKNAAGFFETQIQKGDDSYTSEDIAEVDKVIDFLEHQDIIPPGTFFSAETPEQIAAMRRAIEFGDQIAEEHPEVADMYRDIENGLSNFEIGKILYQELGRDPSMAEHLRVAVGHAIRKLIPKSELLVITRRRRAIILRKNMGEEAEEFRKHQREAAQKRHELGIKVDVKAMIEGAGRTSWTDEEREMVLGQMINDPYYQLQEGQWKGHQNYDLIAEELNDIYHDGRQIRYANSVASLVHDAHRKKKRQQ